MDKRAEDIPTIPLAPEDLRRAYADIAYGYHVKLPELALLAKDAREFARQAIAVAAEARSSAHLAAELAGQCLGRLDQVLRNMPGNDDMLPRPPRPPSGPEFEPEEVTLHGKPIPVVRGEVKLTTSDFATLKTAVRVARETWSLAQKIIVAVGATAVLGLGTLAGVAIQSAWGTAKVAIVHMPSVVVASPVDAGKED